MLCAAIILLSLFANSPMVFTYVTSNDHRKHLSNEMRGYSTAAHRRAKNARAVDAEKLSQNIILRVIISIRTGAQFMDVENCFGGA